MIEQKHTPGPWTFRLFYQDDADEIRSLGLEPTRALTNEGQRTVMSGDTRVALVDCQTEHKRGKGHVTDCAERDANARLIAAAPELLAALQELAAGVLNVERINKAISNATMAP